MKAYIITYGCVANHDNSAIIKGILKDKIVDSINESDVIIVNTCVVKQKTEQRVKSRIKEIIEEYPNKKLIITGCMPKALTEDCRKIAPNASLVDTNHITEILKAVKRVELIGERKENKIGLKKIFDKEASLQIAEGCISQCSFCITKLAKGNLHSFSKKEIVKEIKKLVKNRHKRINLTATDCGCYGFDTGDNIVNLLRDIIEIKGEFTVRVGMINPGFVIGYLDGLIDVFKNKKIMKFLHIPVQSGSDKVLRDMNRQYKINDFLKIVDKFRKEIPDIDISTDIIAGYPTETEQDFRKTAELIKKIKPEVLNISRFGVRKGTKAERLKPLPSEVVKRRSVELNKIKRKIKN